MVAWSLQACLLERLDLLMMLLQPGKQAERQLASGALFGVPRVPRLIHIIVFHKPPWFLHSLRYYTRSAIFTIVLEA